MPDNFEPGDVVRLKSGGPNMTIDSIETFDGRPQATCVWFDDKNERQTGVFDLVTLDKM